MVSLILGIILIAFCVFAVLPSFPLGWGLEVVSFLKGCAPVLAAFVGLVLLFIGAADIKDKKESKREEKEASQNEQNASK